MKEKGEQIVMDNIILENETKVSLLRQLTINVTKEIIDSAERRNSGHCMISDATLKSATRAGYRIGRIATDLQTIRFTNLKNGWRYIYLTPRIAQRSLIDFDLGKPTAPFKCLLQPVQIIRNGKNKLGKSTSTSKKTPKAYIRINKKGQGTKKPLLNEGKTPPIAALPGQRREFGLHSLGAFEKLQSK